MLNVVAIIVSKMTSHCTGTVQMKEESERGIRKWEEMWFKTTADDTERGAAVTCDESPESALTPLMWILRKPYYELFRDLSRCNIVLLCAVTNSRTSVKLIVWAGIHFSLAAHATLWTLKDFTTAQCYAERGYATLSSVCLSVMFRYRDHIGWNASKIISQPNSLRHLLTLAPTWPIWFDGKIPKIRVE